MPVKCYQDLVVWQKAMRLAREAYLIAKKLPYEEKFALSDQLRRSAVSIPSNMQKGMFAVLIRNLCISCILPAVQMRN